MKSNWWIPFLVLAGLVFLGLSLLISTRTDRSLFAQKPLARLEEGSGKVYVFRKDMTVKERLVRKSFLYALDTVETGADGDAVMEFDSAYRIRILENSLITLDRDQDKITLIIKQGDLQVENYGQEGTVYISRNGRRWTATDYEMVYKKQAQDESLPDTSTAVTPVLPDSKVPSLGGLSQEYIQDVLKSQRNSFFKCYTQLLQRTPGVTGQASLSFTIENSGRVSQAAIASSTISDAAFKACLLEALQRVAFKSYSGETISTVFPLKFE